MEPDQQPHSLKPDNKKYPLHRRFILIFVPIILAVLLAAFLYNLHGSTDVVPEKIQKSVPFSIYYPRNLPAGYTLDEKSFQIPESGVVLFTVTYGDGKSIDFSEQQQPSSGDIDKFVKSYIPLNSVLQLPLGQVKVGAYGAAPNIRTIASVPIHDGPWLIVTAPSDVNHDDLTKLITSLTK